VSRIRAELSGFSVILTLLSGPVIAQAPDTEDLEPAVSSEVLIRSARSPAESGPAQTASIDAGMQARASEVVDEIELEVTEITGNQELPKMLYIVPWRAFDAGDLVSRPSTSALDNVLAPIDRTEFIRQVDYYSDLYEEADE